MEGPPLPRSKSEASKLVGCFQELNERLSAFERLAQLKRMVMEGKLKQDVFEEMYRINTEKLVDRKGRRGKKHPEMKALSVLEDFQVRHRTQHPNSMLDLTSVSTAKIKRGCLCFDRIVLRSSSAFGSTKETIVIGTQQMTLVFYDDEARRVDLAFENKRQEQFVFESEVEKLMFVESLEKALETAARASTSKDEPVLLGRPNRTNSQIKKEFDARKSACLNLEMMAASPLQQSSQNSFRSNVDTTSTYTEEVREYDEEEDDELLRRNSDTETEQKEEEDNDKTRRHDDVEEKEAESAPASPCSSPTTGLVSTLSSQSIMTPITLPSRVSSSASIVDTPSPTAEAERLAFTERLEDAKKDRLDALERLEQKKLRVKTARQAEDVEQQHLKEAKAAEDEAIKNAVQSREEDVQAAKNLADCVANEIAALNALDPDDILSSTTNKAGDESTDPNVLMSNDLRALIGKPTIPLPATMSPHAKLQYNLQQARKALAAARARVEKTSERRRLMEAARREARKVVSAQMTKCSQALKEVTRAESSVLAAKADVTQAEERVAHYEQCLLILEEHRKMRSPTPKPIVSFVEMGIPPENKEAIFETSIIT